jgi:hypothetical protein
MGPFGGLGFSIRRDRNRKFELNESKNEVGATKYAIVENVV